MLTLVGSLDFSRLKIFKGGREGEGEFCVYASSVVSWMKEGGKAYSSRGRGRANPSERSAPGCHQQNFAPGASPTCVSRLELLST